MRICVLMHINLCRLVRAQFDMFFSYTIYFIYSMCYDVRMEVNRDFEIDRISTKTKRYQVHQQKKNLKNSVPYTIHIRIKKYPIWPQPHRSLISFLNIILILTPNSVEREQSDKIMQRFYFNAATVFGICHLLGFRFSLSFSRTLICTNIHKLANFIYK